MPSVTKLSVHFGKIVRRRREKTNLSQMQLAERAGVHYNYISQIERGQKNPSLDIAARIAGALGATLSQLVREAEREQTDS
jgi:transcriptional regulator with XRE-family HTH domain